MSLFLAQLCMFITSQKILENSIPFEQIFFNTSLKVSQKNKCISIVVLLVFNFKNASRLYEHPIYIYIDLRNEYNLNEISCKFQKLDLKPQTNFNALIYHDKLISLKKYTK